MSEHSERTPIDERSDPDVLVIGAGLAGLWAAHLLPQGLDVLILDGGGGETDLAGGGLEWPGAETGDRNELLRLLSASPAALGPTGARASIPTEHGDHRPAQLAPLAMIAVAPDIGPRAAVVRIPGLENHLPERAAQRLGRAAGSDRPLAMVAIEAPLFTSRSWGHAELAAALDDDGPAEQFLEACREGLAGSGADRLLFPPILGLRRHRERVLALERQLDLAVQELEAAGPAAPGLRLRLALRERLAGRVRICEARAQGLTIEDRRVSAVSYQAAGGERQTCAPRRVIMATGRFVGGGLTSGPLPFACAKGPIREPLADCAVFADGRNLAGIPVHELFAPEPWERHAILAAGLQLDESRRPLGHEGQARAENLFACGLIVGGHDPAHDRGTAGLVLDSARRAAEAASR